MMGCYSNGKAPIGYRTALATVVLTCTSCKHAWMGIFLVGTWQTGDKLRNQEKKLGWLVPDGGLRRKERINCISHGNPLSFYHICFTIALLPYTQCAFRPTSHTLILFISFFLQFHISDTSLNTSRKRWSSHCSRAWTSKLSSLRDHVIIINKKTLPLIIIYENNPKTNLYLKTQILKIVFFAYSRNANVHLYSIL